MSTWCIKANRDVSPCQLLNDIMSCKNDRHKIQVVQEIQQSIHAWELHCQKSVNVFVSVFVLMLLFGLLVFLC